MEGLLWRRGAATPWKKRHASLVVDGDLVLLVNAILSLELQVGGGVAARPERCA